MCTTISNDYGVKVSTIEHLMGAFYGFGIDNALVEIDSQEVPILDGSAKTFISNIRDVGLKFSDQPIKIIKINKIDFFMSEFYQIIFYDEALSLPNSSLATVLLCTSSGPSPILRYLVDWNRPARIVSCETPSPP